MRLVTWNLNRATWSSRRRFDDGDEHNRTAWDALRELGADVALVQEACPPPEGLADPPTATLPAGIDAEDWRSLPGPRRLWCSAIATWGIDLTEPSVEGVEPLDATHKGAYRVGVVPWGDEDLYVISIYALWDYAGLTEGEKPRYAETSMHRSISDITPLIDQNRRQRRHVVLAGDFNASTQFPEPYRAAYGLVHQRVETLGLRNVSVRREHEDIDGCPCADEPCRHIQTYEGATPYQNDYVYASPEVADAMKLHVQKLEDLHERVSDHLPVVVGLD